jgi:hypothetical protein
MRLLREAGWIALIGYIIVAHYCDFKQAMGIPSTVCTCRFNKE